MEINMKKYRLNSFKEKDLFSWDEIISVLEEQEWEIEDLNGKIRDLESNIRDNYKKIPYAEQVGISDNDFI